MAAISKVFLALAGLIVAVASIDAQEMKEKTVTEQIVGAWAVISVVNESEGKKVEPFGAKPKGTFIFTADGNFSTNIIRPGRTQFASNNRMIGTPDENKEAVQGNISTFGTYAVSSDGSINLEVIGSNFPNWDGAKQKSLVEIKGDEMTWTSPTASTGGNTVIVLQRAKSGWRYPQQSMRRFCE